MRHGRLHARRQLPKQTGRRDDPVQPGRADVRRRVEQRAKRIRGAFQPLRLLIEPVDPRLPRDDFHLGARFVQQRRRLDGALSAADDHDALAGKGFEAAILAGVRDQLRRTALEGRGPPRELRDAGGDDDPLHFHLRLVFKPEAESARGLLDFAHAPRIEIGHDLPLKPLAVAHELRARQRMRRVDLFRGEIAIQRPHALRIGDVRGRANGAHEHPFRHLLVPKLHRFAKDDALDVGRAQMGGGGQSVRAGADDGDLRGEWAVHGLGKDGEQFRLVRHGIIPRDAAARCRSVRRRPAAPW